ncbi:unnamed protein product, partial [Candidula unifasciata]
MDKDGEVQSEDDVNASAACSTTLLAEGSGNGKEDAADKSDDNNNDGSDVDSSKQVKGQDICGSVRSHSKVWSSQQEQPQVVKRRHVQSRRMQEYQQQLTKQPFRNARICAVCGHTLYSGPGYRYHLQRHRRDNESFPCDKCRKVFK